MLVDISTDEARVLHLLLDERAKDETLVADSRRTAVRLRDRMADLMESGDIQERLIRPARV